MTRGGVLGPSLQNTFWGPLSRSLASLPTWVSIVDIIGHKLDYTDACMLQPVWKIAQKRHMMVP